VVLVIMSGLYGGLVLVRLVYSPSAFILPSLSAVFSTVVTFVVAVGYLTACWTVSGSTAGAVAMGLRVVGRRSQRVSLPVGLLRAIGCVLFPIGLLWVVVDRRRKSLQDVVFRTHVVYSRPLAR
jgi:uncharacterized RDD family membrane protein YckC